MLTYDLAKRLKEAGFPMNEDGTDGRGDFGPFNVYDGDSKNARKAYYFFPTLSELIEACGEGLSSLTRSPSNTWYVATPKGKDDHVYELVVGDEYPTPEEAVASFWLALNEKK